MPRTLMRVLYALPIATIAAMFAAFQLTDPIAIGPGGILAIFVLIYLFFLSSFFILLHAGLGVVSRIINRKREITPRVWNLGVKKSYYIASIVAFAPVCLLAIQSIGQLQLRDIGLVFLLCAIAIFYVIKRG